MNGTFAQRLFTREIERMRADAAAARERQEQERAHAEIAAMQRAILSRAAARAMNNGFN